NIVRALRCAFCTLAALVCDGFAACRSRHASRRKHRNGACSPQSLPGSWITRAQDALRDGVGTRSGLHPKYFRRSHQYPSADGKAQSSVRETRTSGHSAPAATRRGGSLERSCALASSRGSVVPDDRKLSSWLCQHASNDGKLLSVSCQFRG